MLSDFFLPWDMDTSCSWKQALHVALISVNSFSIKVLIDMVLQFYLSYFFWSWFMGCSCSMKQSFHITLVSINCFLIIVLSNMIFKFLFWWILLKSGRWWRIQLLLLFWIVFHKSAYLTFISVDRAVVIWLWVNTLVPALDL